jgi:hypothetical protein
VTAGVLGRLARLAVVAAVLWACVAVPVAVGWPWPLLVLVPALGLYLAAAWRLLHQ